MKTIAIVGTGAVGGCYGAKLHQAGNNVLFHMRGENFAAGQQRGFSLYSATNGDVHISPKELRAFQSTSDMAKAVDDGFDWVIVALKSTAMEQIAELVGPLLSSKTRLLLLMNGLVEDAFLHRIKKQGYQYHSVFGGMAFVCAERTKPAVVVHTRYGSITAALADTTCANTNFDEEEASLKSLLEGTDVSLTYETSLLRGRWKKMMVNLSFNGLCVAMGGVTVDKIVADPKLRDTASTIMDEAAAIGNAELAEKYGSGNFEPLGTMEKTAMMGWCDGVGEFAPSTLVDYKKGQQMEIRYMFQEPIIRSDRLGVPCPVLKAVVAKIEKLAPGGVSPKKKKALMSSKSATLADAFLDRVPFSNLTQNVQTVNY